MKTIYFIIVVALAIFVITYFLTCILTCLARCRQTKCKFIRVRIAMAKVGIALCFVHFIATFYYPQELYWFLIGILGAVFLFREIKIGNIRLENMER